MSNKRVEYTGKRFGQLLVINRNDRKDNSGRMTAFLTCKCDCGNVKEYRSACLVSKDTVSCGCYKIKNNKKRKLPNDLAAKRHVFSYYKRNANRRNIEFDLDFDFFIEMVKNNCFYCEDNSTNKAIKNSSIWYYTGIDRLDNSKGYIKGNCVSCCKRCNMAKSNGSIEDFKNWTKRVYEHIFHK